MSKRQLFIATIPVIVATLFFGGCSRNAKHPDSFVPWTNYQHDSLNDWLDNASSMYIRFWDDGLTVEIFGTKEGVFAKYCDETQSEDVVNMKRGTLYGTLLEQCNGNRNPLIIRLNDTEMWQDILKRLYNSTRVLWRGYNYMITVIDCSSWKIEVYTLRQHEEF